MSVMSLWMPIVVSAVVVFVVSAVVWMVLPHHKKDIRSLPDERRMIEFLETQSIPPGTYMWPNCGEDGPNSEAFRARYAAGPWGTINILAAQPNFGRNLLLTFLFYVVVGVFVAYVSAQARVAGASFAEVFRVAGTVAIVAYCFASIPGAIFMGKPTRFMVTEFLDGLAYGLITGLIFAWLWPSASVL